METPKKENNYSGSSFRGAGQNPNKSKIMKELELPQSVQVFVKNGHLKYAKHPVFIGHFKDDGIVSAERVMDHLLGKKLSERLDIGSYPGPIESNLVLLPEGDHFLDLGAIIVGLGEPENLTPFRLSKTIELGCLEYALNKRDAQDGFQPESVGISTLLVGSSYGYLSLSNSINAVLEGVFNANNKILKRNSDMPFITEIEFIELYRDKALNAFYFLNQIDQGSKLYKIDLQYPIKEVGERRSFMPVFDEEEWWKRITALVKTDEATGKRKFYFSASTGRANVIERELATNQQIIESLLQENSLDSKWNRRLAKTIFELIVPHDFKLSFRNQQNILLILDKDTAWYPWELLHYDDKDGKPICVSAGMIRQLSTSEDRRRIKPVNNKKAFIIGDPLLSDSTMPQLPGARKEALAVEKLLKQSEYNPTSSIRKSFNKIVAQLYDEYKIIHIASHGVIDYGPDRKTGILLSDNVVLTTAEINQISTTPELVFVNCCHLGEIKASKEKHFRDKYRLAANIGTQLIENGVKAVVVAGWAVDDRAAQLFAEEFYTKMLAGETFAEAAKAARAACYAAFPDFNTWGAYQCYGDQFYQLNKRSIQKKTDQPYLLDKEILIDLEILINDAQSSRKRDDGLKEKLESISRRIDDSKLRNGQIAELEAIAYGEILEYETAIKKYEFLHTVNNANYSVRSIEQWCNLRVQHLLSQKGSADLESLLQQMDEVVAWLERLRDFGETMERYSLLGSAFKRKSMLVDTKEAKAAAIRIMADHYKKAFLLENENLEKDDIYPLTNWITAEKLLDEKGRLQEVGNRLDPKGSIESFLDAKIAKVQSSRDIKEFWDLIEIINLNLCKLLFINSPKAQRSILEEIKEHYRKAWFIGGSKKQKNTEIAHMDFVLDALKAFGKQKSGWFSIISDLKDFFKDIDLQN